MVPKFLILLCICLISGVNFSSSLNQTNLNESAKHLFPEIMNIAFLPLDKLIDMTQKIQPSDVTFHLYTRENKNSGTAITKDTLKKVIEKADLKEMTIIISHGWGGSHQVPSVQVLKNVYLERHNYNILLVNWSPVAVNKNYPVPARSVHQIGRIVSDMINELLSLGLKANLIHLIGFSLGAHVVAEAGNFVIQKVDRVTLLDAAAPTVSNHTKFMSAGRFVDAIHTCAPVIGIREAIAMVDFYPNGGTVPQPDCPARDTVVQECSHNYAWVVFAETIKNPKRFPGKKCTNRFLAIINGKKCKGDVEYMGEQVSHNARGTYFVKTKGVNVPNYRN